MLSIELNFIKKRVGSFKTKVVRGWDVVWVTHALGIQTKLTEYEQTTSCFALRIVFTRFNFDQL